ADFSRGEWTHYSELVFFQAEDGIRVFHVTGVQTCALPILELMFGVLLVVGLFTRPVAFLAAGFCAVGYWVVHGTGNFFPILNGEIGRASCRKECGSRCPPSHEIGCEL